MDRLASRVVYENPWMTVREDDIRHLDGSTGIYGVVEKQDFALVVPREADGFWMVEQYRYPVARRAWEFPQGSWSPGAGETGRGGTGHGDARALAETELAEETGLRAGSMEHLGSLFTAYGFCAQRFDVFLATGLVQGEPDREPSEQDMVHRFVREDELWGMVASGEVADAHTLAALALFQRSRD